MRVAGWCVICVGACLAGSPVWAGNASVSVSHSQSAASRARAVDRLIGLLRAILATAGSRDWAAVRSALPGAEWEAAGPVEGDEGELVLNGALHSPLGLLGLRLAGSTTQVATVEVSTSPGDEDRGLAWTDLRAALARAGMTYEELGLLCSQDSEERAIRLSSAGRDVILNYTAYVERALSPDHFALIVYRLSLVPGDSEFITERETEYCRHV